VPWKLKEEISELVECGGAVTESDFIREALRDKLKEKRELNK